MFPSSPDDLGRPSLPSTLSTLGNGRPIYHNYGCIPRHYWNRNWYYAEIRGRWVHIQPIDLSYCVCLQNDGLNRLCIDERWMNAITVKDSFPFSRMHDSVNALWVCFWFQYVRPSQWLLAGGNGSVIDWRQHSQQGVAWINFWSCLSVSAMPQQRFMGSFLDIPMKCALFTRIIQS